MSGIKRFNKSDYNRWQRKRDAGLSLKEIAKADGVCLDHVQTKTTKPDDIITLGRLYKMLKDGDHVGNKTIVYAGKVCGKFEQKDETNG